METTKLFFVRGSLGKDGYSHNVIETNILKETNKLFITDRKHISKDKIMKIETIFIETHNHLIYSTYCKDGQQQEALNMLKEHINNKVNQYKREIDLLHSFTLK